jgi:hypothetical protein
MSKPLLVVALIALVIMVVAYDFGFSERTPEEFEKWCFSIRAPGAIGRTVYAPSAKTREYYNLPSSMSLPSRCIIEFSTEEEAKKACGTLPISKYPHVDGTTTWSCSRSE